MALYEYQAADGSKIERIMGMNDPHPRVIRQGGKEYRRVWNVQRPVVERVDLKSISLPPHWPHAKRHAKDGSPIFESKREREEAIARSRDSEHDQAMKATDVA